MASMGMGPGLVVTVRATRHEWAHKHAAPLIASAVALVAGMNYVTLWPALRSGRFGVFRAPSDLWGTYLAAIALVHGHYRSPFLGMVGSLLIEAPAAAVGDALHLQVGPQFAAYAAPTGWVLMGPYTLLLSCISLFAFDAAARRMGFDRRLRLALAVVEAVLVVNVTAVWGHPEDAVAVGLAVYGLLDVDRARLLRAGWLLGVAVAVQPLAILFVPAAVATVWRRHGRGDAQQLVLRSLAPYVAVLIPPLCTDFSGTLKWLVEQPNWPGLNHATPFTSLAAHVGGSGGGVTAGPARLVGIALTVGVAVLVCGRARAEPTFERCLWAATAGVVLWVCTDSVVDSYYTWPALALTVLLAARRNWLLGAGVAALAGFSTWFSNLTWHGSWSWWGVTAATLAVGLAAAWYAANGEAREDRQPVYSGRSRNTGLAALAAAVSAPAPPRRRGRALIPPWTG